MSFLNELHEEKKTNKLPNNVILENRHILSITGVKDVDSFDEQTVVAYTDLGELTIKGFNLHISKLSLDSGELSIDGEISALIYSDNSSRNTSFFSKLFR